MVIPYLYAHITLKIQKVEGGHCHPGLRKLIYQLMRNPELAESVRSITFPHTWEYGVAHTPDGHDLSTDNSIEIFAPRGKLGRCKDEPYESWRASEIETTRKSRGLGETATTKGSIQATELKSEGMHVALLLHATPNLQILDIMEPCHEVDHTMTVLELSANTHNFLGPYERVAGVDKSLLRDLPLQNIRKIACTFNYQYPSSCHASLALFLRLPSIREIFIRQFPSGLGLDDGQMDDHYMSDMFWESLSDKPSTVERLELHTCYMDDESLEIALRPCKSLKTLVYDCDSYLLNDHNDDHDWLCIPGLEKALSVMEASLENLRIDGPECENMFEEHEYHMLSLSRFQKLKNLSMRLFLFFGWTDMDVPYSTESTEQMSLPDLVPLLPQSLEKLVISGITSRFKIVISVLTRLLQHKSSRLPRLRKIILMGPATPKVLRPSMKKLRALAKASNVKFYRVDETTGLNIEDRAFHIPEILNSESGWAGREMFAERLAGLKIFEDW